MEKNFTRELRSRTIRTFIDVLILNELNERPMPANNIIILVHQRFGFPISSGTIYSAVYSLLIKGYVKEWQRRGGSVYALTDEGRKILATLSKAAKNLQVLVADIFKASEFKTLL